MALTSKSNEITLAYERVKKLIQEGENPPVPLHIRNAPIESMEDLGYGIGYQYGYNKNQTYLPKQYLDKHFIDVERAVTDVRTISLEREDKRMKMGCSVCWNGVLALFVSPHSLAEKSYDEVYSSSQSM